jgi:hypothetical protein
MIPTRRERTQGLYNEERLIQRSIDVRRDMEKTLARIHNRVSDQEAQAVHADAQPFKESLRGQKTKGKRAALVVSYTSSAAAATSFFTMLATGPADKTSVHIVPVEQLANMIAHASNARELAEIGLFAVAVSFGGIAYKLRKGIKGYVVERNGEKAETY